MATQSAPGGSRWRALGALLRPDVWRWVGLGALVATASALTIAGPLVVRRIVDTAADGTTAAEITGLALLFLAIAALAQLLAVIVAWLATVAAWRTTNELRLTMTRHVLGLDHEGVPLLLRLPSPDVAHVRPPRRRARRQRQPDDHVYRKAGI